MSCVRSISAIMSSYGSNAPSSLLYSYMNGALGVDAWSVGSCTVLVLLALLLSSYYWVRWHWPWTFERMRDDTCPLPLPPGTMGCPFVGESLEFARKGADFYSSRLRRYGKVYKTHLLGRPTVRLVGAEHVRPVLMGEHITVRSQWPQSVRRLVGSHSLLGMSGDDHRVTKCFIASLFTPTILASFVPRIQAVVRRHLDRWCEVSADQGQLLGFPHCQQLSLDLSAETVFGLEPGQTQRADLLAAFRQFVDNLFSLPFLIPGCGLWKGLQARERILQVVRHHLDNTQPRDDDGFQSLMELMRQIPEMNQQSKLIEDNTLELLFAGYTTTSSALCSHLLSLGRNPQVLRKVEEELDALGLLDDLDSPLTYDIVGRLRYVHGVNSEVLRVYPPIGAGFRKANNTLQIGGFQVPKEWTVAYSIRETQETSEVFHDREKFLPERWLAEDSEELKEKMRYQYIPFGLGARACVGKRLALLQQAVFLVEVVRRCRYHLHNPDPVIKYIPITKPADDLPVTFRRRAGTDSRSSTCF